MLWEHELWVNFSTTFLILLNFHECFYNSTETQMTCFLFLKKTLRGKKKKQLVYFDQNVHSLWLCHHHVDSSVMCFYPVIETKS